MRRGIGIAACFVAIALLGAGPDKDPAFEAAKLNFQKEMKKKFPADRATAVLTLAAFPKPESVELVLKRGMIDPDLQVRTAVRKTLRALADNVDGRDLLLSELQKSRKKTSGPEELQTELIRALAPVSDEKCQTQIAEFLDEYLASPKANWMAPMGLIDEFGVQADADAFAAVTTFSKARAFENKFGYQRCVIQAMTHIKDPEAIGFLIDFLPKAEGLIQLDVVTHLTRVTGQPFRGNAEQWKEWWAANWRTFKFPATYAAVPDLGTIGDQPTYYRIPICAKRVVFVLDTSGSMRGAAIDAAKGALLAAIDALPESVSFDIVLFSKGATTVSPRLLPATSEFKLNAQRVVRTEPLGGGTASNAALHAAFNLEPEAIYFLSDGEPTDATPSQIYEAVTALNRTRRVSIYTIGVITDRGNGSGLTQFMQPLAEKNWGTFQLVQ